jgi:hypothetical protein
LTKYYVVVGVMMLFCTYKVDSRVEPHFVLALDKSIGFVLKTLVTKLWLFGRALALPYTLLEKTRMQK